MSTLDTEHFAVDASTDFAPHRGDDMLGARQVTVFRWRKQHLSELDDWVSQEVPIALELNGISHAVMLATPTDLEDFALGFGISEGIFSSEADLYGCEVVESEFGTTVSMEVSSRSFAALKQRRRTLVGRTGCGICGTESLAQVFRNVPIALSKNKIRAQSIALAMESLRNRQVLNRLTGSLHAAAWCDRLGNVQLIREDVGRHNALDKLIGAMVNAKINSANGFIAVTSRASIEMVQKAAMLSVPVIAAVSAPTQLAINTAAMSGMTLVGLVRHDDLVIYANAHRILFPEPH